MNKQDITHILLIEDNPGDADLLEGMLEDSGSSSLYHIIHAKRLSEGKKILKENSAITIILSDVQLPDSQGYDTLHNLRKSADHLPIVFITGSADEELAITSIKEGIQDYLPKGKFDGELLIRTIRYAIERKKIEETVLRVQEEIKTSEEKYRTLFNSIDEGFCVVEIILDKNRKPIDYRVLETNPVFERQTGLVHAIGNTAIEMGLEQEWIDLYGSVAVTGKSVRFIQDSESLGKWFDVYASKIGGEGSLKVAIVFNDITERKKAEEALKKSRERQDIMLQATKVGLWYCDLPFDELIWDEKVKEHFWLPPDARVTIDIFYEHMHPDDRERTREAIEDSITNHTVYDIEYRTVRQSDGQVKWIRAIGRTFYDPQDNPMRFDGVTIDITEHKRLEQQKDEFLGIASHELKTPVTSIKAYGQVLQTVFKRKGDMQAVEQLQKMDAQINKLTNLIGDLLDVTKIHSGRLEFHEEYFDFNELVSEIVDELQLTTERHTIHKELAKTKTIFGDKERIGQVLTNLITNAIKYSPHTEKIVVTANSDNKHVTVCVQDFGVGIPKEKQDKVFQQFFRVSGPKHNTIPGLGLGLYISNEIIKRQEGKIWVESSIGKGSTFCFSLPLERSNNYQEKNTLVNEDIKHE